MNNKYRSFQAMYSLCLHAGAFMSCYFVLSLTFLSSEVLASNSSPNNFCKSYDWMKVEELVQPYLDEASFTTFVMQGLSSEYNTSVAAYQALHSQLPEDINNILNRIVKLNCP